MIILDMYAKNIFRIKELYINFNNPGLNYLKGINHDVGESNEAGKSSIFNTLCYCFFGRYPSLRGKAADNIVNSTIGYGTEVKTTIMEGEKKYVIKRTRKSGENNKESKVFIHYIDDSGTKMNDYNLLDKTAPKQSEYAIQNILGMDYETFVRAYYFPTSNIEPFCTMTDRVLKTFFLEKLLDIDWVEEAYQKAKKELETIVKFINIEEINIEMCNKNIENYNDQIKDYNIAKETWKKNKKVDIEEKYNELKTHISHLDDKKISVATQYGKVISIKTNLEKLPKEKEIKDDTNAFDREIYKIESHIINAEARKKTLRKDIEKRKKQIKTNESLVGTKCRECGNIIIKDNLKHIHGNLEEDLVSLEDELAAQIENLYYYPQDLERYKEYKKEAENKIQEEKDKNKEITDQRHKLEQEAFSILKEIEYEEKSISQVQNIIKSFAKDIKKNKKEKNPYEGFIIKTKEKIKETYKELDKFKSNIKSLMEQKEIVEFWYEAFSPRGIQSFLLESITNAINLYVRDYMRYLSEDRITVKFNTIKKLKSGEIRENFGIEISNVDGSDSFQSLSEGAKSRVNLACALAIGDFKRSLGQKKLEFICLDETIAHMDSYWVNRFVVMMKERFPNYSKYIVSHQNLDEDLFDKVIVVEKKNGETYIQR